MNIWIELLLASPFVLLIALALREQWRNHEAKMEMIKENREMLRSLHQSMKEANERLEAERKTKQ